MAASFAAIAGAAAAAAALALSILLTFLLRFLKSQFRHSSSNKGSETGSSDPSAVDTKRGGAASPGQTVPQLGARQFRMEELEQATMQFNESSLIGCGTFGLVFKGLLHDGTVVAIKRREGHPRQEFADEVAYMSAIEHRHLVSLIGYCQERGCQMLVFEYLPNSSICNHLYDTGNDSTTKLEFKQRLSIAIGAAKGLHVPQSVHSNFKTSNVLVDENFIAKVADAGLSKLLEKIEDDAGSSCSNPFNAFRDPEFGVHDSFQDMSDVYSFGVFLLELISAKEAAYNREAFQSNGSIYQWVKDCLNLDELIDQRLIGSFTAEGMRDLIKLMLKCMRFPGIERPRMENVVMELDQILENEMTRTTVMGEGTATVTLGSWLFTN